MTGGETAATVHATCLCLRETGILIRGPSGSGKSTLARELILEGRRAGWFARLIGDDRVRLSPHGGRIVARPHEAVAGLIEAWGSGIERTLFAPACVVRLVVELGTFPRQPVIETADVLGLDLPVVHTDRAHARTAVLWRIRDRDDTGVTER